MTRPFAWRDPGDLAALDDPGAAHARALGQRLGDVDRVGLAVARDEDRADQVVDREQRMARLRLGRARAPRPRGRRSRPIEAARLQLDEALRGAREAEAAVLAEAGRLPGLGLEPGVELGRVLGEPGQVLGRAQLADQPGGMPGGARGQLPALEQQHVPPAELGQVIGDARTRPRRRR